MDERNDKMNEYLQSLREKYMFWTENGEICSFDNDLLLEGEKDLQSDLGELLEDGIYSSNNEKVVSRIIKCINRLQINYEIENNSRNWKYQIKICKYA
jgi:hypothetical protein